MSNVVRFRTKEQPDRRRRHNSLSDVDLVALESLRNSWKLIAVNLRQIKAHLAECKNVLQTMSESPEKVQFMILVANTRKNLVASIIKAESFETGESLVKTQRGFGHGSCVMSNAGPNGDAYEPLVDEFWIG